MIRCFSVLVLLSCLILLLHVCPVVVCEEEYEFPDPVEWEKTLNEEVINIDFTKPPPPPPKPKKQKKQPTATNAPTPTNKGPAPPSPFKSTARQSEFIAAFGEWQNNTIMHKSCRRAQVIFFKPVAGFGDSVNAFYTAIRQAFSLGRLFLMDWSVSIDTPRGDAIEVALWKIGIHAPFLWDFHEVRALAPWCKLPLTRDIKISSNMNDRIIPIYGQLAMGHILSATTDDDSPLKINVVGKDGSFKKVERVNHMDMAGITEEWMANHLLVPNESIQSRLTPIVESWRSKKAVIAMHIRTGAVDGDGKTVPAYARFLAPKDESRFTRFASKLILDKYDDDRQDIQIFVATDDPTIVPNIAQQLAGAIVARINAQATGLEIVPSKSLSQSQSHETSTPAAVHSGPSRTISIPQSVASNSREYKPQPQAMIALERMFLEWFLLRQANHVILTAWSLFGSTATNTHRSVRIINSSKCGKDGSKACYPGAITN